jgi:hypothetical protein
LKINALPGFCGKGEASLKNIEISAFGRMGSFPQLIHNGSPKKTLIFELYSAP